MTRLPLFLIVLALLGVTLLSGCGREAGRAADALAPAQRSASPVRAQTGPLARPALPAPDALLSAKPRSSSYVEGDLLKNGADFDPGIPAQQVAVNGSEADFSPSAASGTGLAGSAYALYRFSAPDYDRNPQLRLTRSVSPAAFADSWIALGNFTTNRWDWFHDEPDAKLDFASFAPYFSASGELLVVVLETGSSVSTLSSLRLGGLAPTASLSATPPSGASPLQVTLDASASTPGEGSITNYAWDTDGDGTFETDGGTTPTLDHEYATEGAFTPAVQVTNTLGNTATASASVGVSNFWRHTLGRTESDYFTAVTQDTDGNVYLAGVTSTPGAPTVFSILLVKLSPTGELVWAHTFRGAENVDCAALAINTSGELILAGSIYVGPTDKDCLVQAWSLDGNQLWSSRFGNTDLESLSAMALTDTAIYVGGDSGTPSSDSDIIIAKLDMSGALLWSRKRDLGDDEFCRSLAIKRTGSTVNGVIMAAAQYDGTNSDLWKLEWQPDGSLISGLVFDDPSLHEDVFGVLYERADTLAQGVYYLAGRLQVAGVNNLSVLSIPGSAGDSSFYGSYIAMGPNGGVASLCKDAGGDLLLAGYKGNATNSQAVLARFDHDDGSFLAAEETKPLAASSIFIQVLETSHGLLLAGASKRPSYSWESISPLPTAFSATWLSSVGTGSNPGFANSSYLGVTTNITSEMAIDVADPLVDGLVELRPEL